jgi:hypothetical protein
MRLSSRRSMWAPTLVLVGAAVGVAAMLGLTSSTATWPLWVVALAAMIGTVAWLDRRYHLETQVPDPEPEPERRRRTLPTAPGGGYDLERDRTTDKQRYLM